MRAVSLLLISTLVAVVFGDLGYDGIDACSRPYQLTYKHDNTGAAITGSKMALKNAILRGSVIRIVVTSVEGAPPGDFIVTAVNNINIRGSEVCASVLDHVGQRLFRHITPEAYYWYQIFCTTGKFQVVHHKIDGETVLNTAMGKAAVSWYAWDPSPCPTCTTPVYSHFEDGGTHTGHLVNLINSVESGKSFQVLRRDVGYVTPLEMVQVNADRLSVNGQSVWHIGQTYEADGVSYNVVTPYKWLSSLSTTGRKHNQRYSYGGKTKGTENVDTVSLDWFLDPCWRLVYSSNELGQPSYGTVQDLIQAMNHGHRVRVKHGSKVMEVRTGYANADGSAFWGHLIEEISQVGGIGADKNDFLPDANWLWSVVDTAGTVTQDAYYYANNTAVGPRNSAINQPLSWYVDSRRWTRALTVDGASGVLFGSKANIQTAVRSGANVRLRVQDKTPGAPALYLKVDNAIYYASSGEETIMQSMRNLLSDTPRGILGPPQWMFYLVNTKGEIDITKANYATESGFVETNAGTNFVIDFFVDDHVPAV